MYRDAARDVCLCADVDMTAQHRAVGHDHSIGQRAIMCHVCAHHKQAPAANLCYVTRVEGAVDRAVLTKYISVADDSRSRMFRHVHMLGHSAEYRAFEHEIVGT